MEEKQKNKWMSALTVLVALLVLGGVFLATNALRRQTVLPQTQSGGGGVSSANGDGEQVGQAEAASAAPAEYMVSNAFFEVWLTDWVGEVLPAGAGDVWDWKADAALRSCIRQGYSHAAGYNGQDVQAVLAGEVEYEYRRLFREELDAHTDLPLAGHVEETSIYYISPYTAFTAPLGVEVYELQQQDVNLYLVKAHVTRAPIQGAPGAGVEYVATAEALVELDETGPVLHSLTAGPAETQAGGEVPYAALDVGEPHFMITRDEETTLEQAVAGYLLRATGGNAPETFDDIGTQTAAVWLQAGLLRRLEAPDYENTPLFWQQRCEDIFAFDAYTYSEVPFASLEAVEALAHETYGVDGLDPTVLHGYGSGFGYDENTGYYTVEAAARKVGRGIHVWQAESTDDGLLVTATYYRLAEAENGYPLEDTREMHLYGYQSAGPQGGPVAVWQGETVDEALLAEALRASPEWFVTVELALEPVGDGSEWRIASALRLEEAS